MTSSVTNHLRQDRWAWAAARSIWSSDQPTCRDRAEGAVVDVSGTVAGGDAGAVNISAGLGNANLAGSLKGDAQAGSRSGSFSLLSRDLADFGAFQRDAGWRRLPSEPSLRDQRRRCERHGQRARAGARGRSRTTARSMSRGTVRTVGRQRRPHPACRPLRTSRWHRVASCSRSAGGASGSGGTVFLETVGSATAAS